MSLLTSLLAPGNGTSRVFVSAPALYSVGPALGVTTSPAGDPPGRIPSLNFDAAAYEYAMGSFVVPDGWTAGSLVVWWSNTTTSTGDVIWRSQLGSYADGATVTTPTNNDDTIAAPADALTVKRSVLIPTVSLTAGSLARFLLQRRGGDAGDTLANDAGVFGLEIAKVS